jgi:hypothetical protein
MQFETMMKILEGHAQSIATLVGSISVPQARQKPDDDKWSILEVINHLLDEEREDFRVRLDYILHKPGETWPPIDPGGWVVSRNYNQRDLADSLQAFLSERGKSLQWLHSLTDAEWNTTCPTPWGEITAGDMLSAWVAHDVLHLRQLVELHWSLVTQAAEPYSCQYAGDW